MLNFLKLFKIFSSSCGKIEVNSISFPDLGCINPKTLKFKKIKNINSDLEKMILNLDRQFLHAKVLGFIHPKSGKKMEFTSILPQELEKILKILIKLGK